MEFARNWIGRWPQDMAVRHEDMSFEWSEGGREDLCIIDAHSLPRQISDQDFKPVCMNKRQLDSS